MEYFSCNVGVEMNKKLNFRLEVFDYVLVYEVISSSEDITIHRFGETPKEYIASNGVRVVSNSVVTMTNDNDGELKTVDIGGWSNKKGVEVLYFDSKEEAEERKERVLFALKEWAENGYFGGKPEDTFYDPETKSYWV